MSRTIDYLAGHFGDELSVAKLAEVAGVSRNYLAHLFLAGIWLQKSEPQAIHVLAYKKLAEIAERAGVDVPSEMCNAV